MARTPRDRKPTKLELSRRQILGASALVAGGAFAGGFAGGSAGFERERPSSSRLHADVCVVGAGFSGLAAAYRLKQAGANVIVLEARNRVGGRSLSANLRGGGWIDLGGQWVGPTQDRFYALIKEMGGETYPSPGAGAGLQRGILDPSELERVTDEVNGTYDGSDLVEGGFDLIDKLAAALDPEKPWEHPDAERLDAMTFAEWLKTNIANESARSMIGAEVSSIACASPEEISILEIASLVSACHDLDHLFLGEGGAQQDRVIGGTQPIAKAVADRLGPAIKLGQPVRRIQWSDDGATVYSDELSVAARNVIICTPPHLAGAIEYEPSLPTTRVQVTQRWPQGLVIKVQMIYSEPFWRADGLNGASLDYRAVVGETADSGVPEKHSRQGIMTGFIYSAQARKAAVTRGGGAQEAGARRDGQTLRAEGAQSGRLSRNELVDPAMDSRLLHRIPHAGGDDAVPLGGARSGRALALGGHREFHRLAVLH